MSIAQDVEVISQELIGLLGTEAQVEPFSHRYPGFDLNRAYEIVSRVGELRRARGEIPVGRKIGFTNKSIWFDFGIGACFRTPKSGATSKRGQLKFERAGPGEPGGNPPGPCPSLFPGSVSGAALMRPLGVATRQSDRSPLKFEVVGLRHGGLAISQALAPELQR